MLEPDPDLRAPSIAAALDGLNTPVASVPPPPVAPPPARGFRVERTPEDAAVRSIRGLLWVLWGLGWILVPMVFGKLLDLPEAIPIVMFGWLALNFIVTWHKGAVLRAAIRQWNREKATPVGGPPARRGGRGPAPGARAHVRAAPGRGRRRHGGAAGRRASPRRARALRAAASPLTRRGWATRGPSRAGTRRDTGGASGGAGCSGEPPRRAP